MVVNPLKISEEYFLAAAEEMNISLAARKLHISQQCMSRHIQRLEDDYGTLLFNRKPRLSLTPSGKLAVQTLRRIMLLEQGLAAELRETDLGVHGRLRVTAPQARFAAMMPPVLIPFHAKYPNVTVELHGYTTSDSEQKLLNGQSDMFIGINPTRRSQWETVTLGREGMYLAGTPDVFRRSIPDFDARRAEFESGITLAPSCSGIPVIGIHNSSLIGQQLDEYVKESGSALKPVFVSNDAELNILLARKGYALSFCYGMFLDRLKKSGSDTFSDLLAFPLKDYPYINEVCLVYYKDTWKPKYFSDFVDIVSNVLPPCFPLLQG